MRFNIIGSGMAGLLAGVMLKDEVWSIIERSNHIPNNHSAVLRFRSKTVADAVGIDFKEVKAIKATVHWRNPVADALSYSLKTNGTATLRSSTTANGEISTRYIAPSDFIPRMVKKAPPVTLNKEATIDWIRGSRNAGEFTISTIPMPMLMDLLGYERPSNSQLLRFDSRPGTNVICELKDVDAYCSLYVPNPQYPGSRISLTGGDLVVECYGDINDFDESKIILTALQELGIPYSHLITDSIRVKKQPYAKILPIDERERKRFIMWASDEFGVYSLGRFATWRPGLLMDDLVDDVRRIRRLASGAESSYDHR